MFFWNFLPKFVFMKRSIDFLPERKQADLNQLVALIREEVKDTVMVILYGSYAKNTYVECDERRDFGVKMRYLSDYDLLVVTKRRIGASEGTKFSRIAERFMADKNADFQTRPQFINESISKLNNSLSEGRYFYVDIEKEGVVLYDSGAFELAVPRELDFGEINRIAQDYYNKKFTTGKEFLVGTKLYYDVGYYKLASLQLHQATEYFLKTIPLVHILYGYKEHLLEYLIERCKPYTLELEKVFPRHTPEEERLFDLLQRAYIEARYNDKFIVSKADIDALLPKVELLRDITERVCRERFAYYDSQIGR